MDAACAVRSSGTGSAAGTGAIARGGAPVPRHSTQSRWWLAGVSGAPVSCTETLPEALHTSVCCTGCTHGAATATPRAMHHHSNTQRPRAVEVRKAWSRDMGGLSQRTGRPGTRLIVGAIARAHALDLLRETIPI